MYLRHKLQILLLSTSLLFAPGSYAYKGSEIDFYYGGGVGGYYVDLVDDNLTINGGMVNLIVGVEERGWAFEGKGMKFYKSGESLDIISSYSVAYRTIEQGGRYYKFKGGVFFDKNSGADAAEGGLIGASYGIRLSNGHRLELDYEYSKQVYTLSSVDFEFDVHMLSLQYLFGGPKPDHGFE